MFFFLPSFIHKMNTAEFKSATFPNAGPTHLLDDSVMEPHAPSRGQAESSTLSSGISIGEKYFSGGFQLTFKMWCLTRLSWENAIISTPNTENLMKAK